MPLAGYPDYFQCVKSNFTVSDSELFISRQSTKSFTNGTRFFVLSGESFTPEAQNKLLKVLEEPLSGNHIFLFVPKAQALLPTILSRLIVVAGNRSIPPETKVFVEEFIRSSFTGRMVMVEKFLKENDNDESSKLRHRTKEVFSQIEKNFAESILDQTGIGVNTTTKFLSELITIEKYLDDPAPSVRLILEYVAFMCPPGF
ncbi:MAG: hypothetical protein HY226_01360 [Candidatus Vogelbacteria bacterium]|nr:hypothetical protein [Candidatus Vogelbacteria bacterium]